MSAYTKLKNKLFGDSTEASGIEQLRELFAEREADLQLSAVYQQPYPDLQDEPTVVFPYVLFTADGERYSAGKKEFVIPDDGLNEGSNLRYFVSNVNGIAEPENVTFDDVAAVEGTESEATLDNVGDVYIYS